MEVADLEGAPAHGRIQVSKMTGSSCGDVPGCVAADVNDDGTVNVLDLIELLLAFGTACP